MAFDEVFRGFVEKTGFSHILFGMTI